MARYPGSTVQLVEDPPGPPSRSTMLAEIYGPDPYQLHAIAAMVRKEFESVYDIAEVTDTIPADVLRHQVVVDRDKAALSGVSPASAATALQALFGGVVIGRAHLEDEQNPVAIRLMAPQRYAMSPDQMERITVPNANGARIALSEITHTVSVTEDWPILTKNNEFVSFVGGELDTASPVYAVLDLDQRLDGRELPGGTRLSTGNLTLIPAEVNTISGYHLLWDGEMRLTLDAFRDMSGSLTVAVGFVYLLLVAYYRSFAIPLIAMAAIPAAFVGVFPAHWATGTWFSMASMIGIVALAGIVVRSSLLVIDFIRDNEALGMPLREAALQAGAVRLRPIMLTSSAIVLGSAVIYADPMFSGMAVSLIAGTIMSTALTIFLIPTLYFRFASKRRIRGQAY
ncbi:MAG: efflux RND transporter permease subunit, partial [Alphaproteobacteria bacterium]|nr:efflux RND transporter permease subunit [Alphaproteobacteria bacterium]